MAVPASRWDVSSVAQVLDHAAIVDEFVWQNCFQSTVAAAVVESVLLDTRYSRRRWKPLLPPDVCRMPPHHRRHLHHGHPWYPGTRNNSGCPLAATVHATSASGAAVGNLLRHLWFTDVGRPLARQWHKAGGGPTDADDVTVAIWVLNRVGHYVDKTSSPTDPDTMEASGPQKYHHFHPWLPLPQLAAGTQREFVSGWL